MTSSQIAAAVFVVAVLLIAGFAMKGRKWGKSTPPTFGGGGAPPDEPSGPPMAE